MKRITKLEKNVFNNCFQALNNKQHRTVILERRKTQRSDPHDYPRGHFLPRSKKVESELIRSLNEMRSPRKEF